MTYVFLMSELTEIFSQKFYQFADFQLMQLRTLARSCSLSFDLKSRNKMCLGNF